MRATRPGDGAREGRRIACPAVRASALVAFTALAAVALTGCTATAPTGSTPVPRASSGSAASTAAPAEASSAAATSTSAPAMNTASGGFSYQPVASGTIVAVGDIKSADGGTTGHVAIKNVVGSKYELIVSGYRTDDSASRAATLSETSMPTSDQCVEGTDSIDVGEVAPNVDQIITVYLPPEKTGGDPSNLTSLSFADSGGDTSGCSGQITTHAKLTWQFPRPYDDITVVDGGATVGAEGGVTLQADVPTRYTVAAGDTLDGVLRRFGLSVGELQYLNPGSFEQGSDAVPQQGYTWNLSPADR